MSRQRLFIIKNAALAATIGMALLAIGFLSWFNYYAFVDTPIEAFPRSLIVYDLLIDLGAVLLVGILLIVYEKPIRRFLNDVAKGMEIDEACREQAQRRLLNEPFFIVALTLIIWSTGAVFYFYFMMTWGMSPVLVRLNLIDALFIIMITLILVVVTLHSLLQWVYAPIFFPRGRLYQVPGVRRISYRVRVIALLFAYNIIPLATLIRTRYRIRFSGWSIEKQYEFVSQAIWFICPLFIVIGILLTWMMSRNIAKAAGNLIKVLQQVTHGRLDGWVKVTTNDELGYVGDVVNEMTTGLRERDKMRRSIALASELQRSLIPRGDPEVEGLDVAGLCVYSEKTGGDFYDYLFTRPPRKGCLTVAVGDVSDHGIQAALLMASARAFLRQRFAMGGGIDRVVTGVNGQICLDVEESGQFMTLFMADINAVEKTLSWINAGHDSTVLHDPSTGNLSILSSHSPALGLVAEYDYSNHFVRLKPGQIIIIGTDGYWEAQNQKGEMFGKDRFFRLIREQADQPARIMVDNLLRELDNFTHTKITDDVTLVVIKVL